MLLQEQHLHLIIKITTRLFLTAIEPTTAKKMTKTIVAGWFTVDPKKRNEAAQSYQDPVSRDRKAKGFLKFHKV
jgi:hypothetical protein